MTGSINLKTLSSYKKTIDKIPQNKRVNIDREKRRARQVTRTLNLKAEIDI